MCAGVCAYVCVCVCVCVLLPGRGSLTGVHEPPGGARGFARRF